MRLSGPWCAGFEKDREQMERGEEQQRHTKEIRNNVNENWKKREWLVLCGKSSVELYSGHFPIDAKRTVRKPFRDY